ncbi:MAG: hypothetical protein ACOY3M_04950 [Patescibacteria group bacterium]
MRKYALVRVNMSKFASRVKANMLKSDILLIGILILISLALFVPLKGLYFQADEWYLFGKVLSVRDCGLVCLIKPFSYHFVPLSWFTYYYVYKQFQLHTLPYFIFTYIFSIANVLLVYFLSRRFFTKVISFYSALFFLTFSQASQTITWYAASLVGLPSTFLLLSGLLIYANYERKISWGFTVAYISLFVGLLFKEDVIVAVIIIALYELIISRNVKKFTTSAIFISLYLILRFGSIYLYFQNVSELHIGGIDLQNVIKNSIVMPASMLASLLINDHDKVFLGKFIGNTVLSTKIIPYGFILNADIFNEFISFYIVGPVIGIGMGAFLLFQKLIDKNFIRFTLLSVLVTAVPYILLPTSLRLESRHYYISAIFLSLLFGALVRSLLEKYSSKSIIIYVVFSFIILRNTIFFHKDINHALNIARPMASYVQALQQASKYTSSKTIIVNTGDLPPLYSGVGYVAMVVNSNIYRYDSFFKAEDLWNWGSEGYYEHGKIGFRFYLSEKSYLDAELLTVDAQVVKLNWNNKTLKSTVGKYMEK